MGQPLESTTQPGGVPEHWSIPSNTLSPSASSGQPLLSTLAPGGVFGQLSFLSPTPSKSASRVCPPRATVSPPPTTRFWVLSMVLVPGIHRMSRASSRRPTRSVSQRLKPPPNSTLPWLSCGLAFSLGWTREYPPPANRYGLV